MKICLVRRVIRPFCQHNSQRRCSKHSIYVAYLHWKHTSPQGFSSMLPRIHHLQMLQTALETVTYSLCGVNKSSLIALLLIQNFILIVFKVHSIHRKCELILKFWICNGKSFMQLCCHSLDDFFFLLETSEFWSLQIKKGSPLA